MNSLCYKTVFSKHLGALVAVGEHAASQGKANGSFSGLSTAARGSNVSAFFLGALTLTFACVSLAWAAPANNALPTGGVVAQGSAAISQSAANMTINQASARAIVNWQSFDIGQNAKVNIVQPNAQAVLLNRVTGTAPSQIFGQMSANGQVVLVNPNGVTFGKDGSVSAAGLTASTLNTTDADFMAGRNRFTRDGATGQVLNQGTLTATPGGYVALLGASVSNEGKIIAPQGNVALGAAETITLPLSGSSRIKMELTPAAINAAVANKKQAASSPKAVRFTCKPQHWAAPWPASCSPAALTPRARKAARCTCWPTVAASRWTAASPPTAAQQAKPVATSSSGVMPKRVCWPKRPM
ncbi:filamentous hemagglutinin N-terminal domain-containing protein [Limnohabitans planktonicus]|uniref:two-partner secretion domain-containing protein n=1 Tax=Limnohabitans planktonicus TaxID=540060 RepID=UPI001F0BF77E|nr:filamentous hemagglutinin N-terminal domain-containing protein [Limnohabitans planktonicus]